MRECLVQQGQRLLIPTEIAWRVGQRQTIQSFVAATMPNIQEIFSVQGSWYSPNTLSTMVHGHASLTLNPTECTNISLKSVPITTNVVSSNPVQCEVYSIQHYVIRFVSDLGQVGGFLRVLRLPLPIKLAVTIQLKYY